ncbi:hypothetical protein EJB05_42972, partial [Eragrostis curvula]
MKPRALLERLSRPFSSSSSRRDGGRRREEQEEADLEAIAAREQKAFRYETLEAATGRFAEKNQLGRGGFGPVYRGRLQDGREVAVKLLGAGSRQGTKEFRNEATLLSRVQHRNVVNLIGYCSRGADDKLLVYEYVPNESLDKILFSSSSAHGRRGSLGRGGWSQIGQDALQPVAWRLYKKGRSMELLDPAAKSTAVPEQVELCVRIGLLCVQADPRLRPDMKRVVIILSKKQSTLEEPTRPGVPGSRYRRRPHGLRSSHYSVGSSSGTSSPSTSATSHASASASNAMTTSSTHTMRSQGLPSHREEPE